MAETTIADIWIYSILSTDATLAGLVGTRIYRGVAPLNATYPLVVFAFQPGSGQDVRGTGTSNIMVMGDWVIKAIDRNPSASTAFTIANRLYSLLHGKSGSVSGGSVLGCVRNEPIAYVETLDGLIYQHLGGLYQVYLQ